MEMSLVLEVFEHKQTVNTSKSEDMVLKKGVLLPLHWEWVAAPSKGVQLYK